MRYARLISPEIAIKDSLVAFSFWEHPFHGTTISLWRHYSTLDSFCFAHGFYEVVSTTVLCISFPRLYCLLFLFLPCSPLRHYCRETTLKRRWVRKLFYFTFHLITVALRKLEPPVGRSIHWTGTGLGVRSGRQLAWSWYRWKCWRTLQASYRVSFTDEAHTFSIRTNGSMR